MPFLKMKSKISKDSLREKRILGVSKKPLTDSKKLCSERMEHLATANDNCHNNEQQNIGKACFLNGTYRYALWLRFFFFNLLNPSVFGHVCVVPGVIFFYN